MTIKRHFPHLRSRYFMPTCSSSTNSTLSSATGFPRSLIFLQRLTQPSNSDCYNGQLSDSRRNELEMSQRVERSAFSCFWQKVWWRHHKISRLHSGAAKEREQKYFIDMQVRRDTCNISSFGWNCFLYAKEGRASFITARQRIGSDLRYFFMVFLCWLAGFNDTPGCQVK